MNRTVSAVLLTAGLLMAQISAAAVFKPRDFASEEDALRYKALTEELRCLVCQNQSLADSDAELASDLRERLYHMVADGTSNQEIVDFMVARYGNFVLYRPPVTYSTLLLWVGPFVLALVAMLALAMKIRSRRQASHPLELSASEQQRVAELLRVIPSDEVKR